MGRRPKLPPKDTKIIRSLTLEKAAELIFPKGSLDYTVTTPEGYVIKAICDEFTPPKDWRCWKPQKTGSKKSRDLDARIEEIISNKRIYDRLRENKEPCPFYATRWEIALAANNARQWTIERAEVERISRNYEKKLSKYSKDLAHIRDDIFSDGLLGRFRWPDAHIWISHHDQFRDWKERYENDIREIGGLDYIIAAINRRASFEQTIRGAGNPGCRSILIGELTRFWPWLTGNPASVSPGPFSRFVDAVFNCFALKVPGERELREAVDRARNDG